VWVSPLESSPGVGGKEREIGFQERSEKIKSNWRVSRYDPSNTQLVCTSFFFFCGVVFLFFFVCIIKRVDQTKTFYPNTSTLLFFVWTYVAR